MRFLLNLAATLVLVLLLATPAVFSNNLVKFSSLNSGFAIRNLSSKFGQFLKLEKAGSSNNLSFRAEFKTFAQKFALYSKILEIENEDQFEKTIAIINYFPTHGVSIFFNTGKITSGPNQVRLSPGQKIEINLLTAPGQNQKASFSLESWPK